MNTGVGRTRKIRRAAGLGTIAAVAVAGCFGAGEESGSDAEPQSSAVVRAGRRAYDGAPPTVPHRSFGADCTNCHNQRGRSVSGVGFAPASPHEGTDFEDATGRCRQCHVFRTTDGLFVENSFEGVAQDLAAGDRATPGAPPRIPHRVLMRENCIACHEGPGARPAIRTDHPERVRCLQCHVAIETTDRFESELDPVGSELD
jgi:cytochrome c-type protein NapB